jgi:haloacetate dehalogenase
MTRLFPKLSGGGTRLACTLDGELFQPNLGAVINKIKTLEDIDPRRRHFFGMVAMALAAAQVGLVRSASARSKTAGPPAVNTGEFFPGFSTELVETSGTTIHVLRKGIGRPLLLLHGYPETHLTWHKVAPQLAEQFSVVVPDLRGYGDSGKPQGGERHENYSFRAMAQDQVDVMRHYGHERFLVAAHDRGARVAHRLCLDHPESVERACLMDIAPTLTMYRGTNQEFATKYMWWFFLIQPFPLPEHMIGLDTEFFLKEMFGGLNKTPGAIAPDAMNEYVRAFSNPDAIHASCEDFRAAPTSTWKWTRPTMRPVERSNARFMSCGAQRIQSAPCGTCLLLGEKRAPHR